MNIDNDVYCNKLRQHSKELIKRDGKSLVDLLLHIHDSTVNLSLIPFCALYCRSVKEFLGVEDLESDTEKEVKDIRNGLKIFTGKYSKGKNMAFNSDYQQNQRFKNMLRFSFLKYFRFLYKGIIINHNKKPSQPTLKRRFFKKKAAFFSWPGLGKEWC